LPYPFGLFGLGGKITLLHYSKQYILLYKIMQANPALTAKKWNGLCFTTYKQSSVYEKDY